jgi:hypothetical protein
VASLATRLQKLEERRAAEAAAEIMRRARSASTDALARFLLAFELADPEVTLEEAERQAWGYLDVPMAMAQTASQQEEGTAWLGYQLGALLARRPGLREHMKKDTQRPPRGGLARC